MISHDHGPSNTLELENNKINSSSIRVPVVNFYEETSSTTPSGG